MWPAGLGQDGAIDLDNLRTGQRGQATPVVDPGENQPIMLVSGWVVWLEYGYYQPAWPQSRFGPSRWPPAT